MNVSSRYRSACLYVGSAVAATFAIAAPVQAAAFSSVSGNFQIDFLSSPLEIGTFTDTDSNAVSGGGLIEVSGDADADFEVLSTGGVLEASVFSSAEGSDGAFFGFSESLALSDGLFSFEADETFSFTFSGSLELNTEIDDAEQESAFASGEFGLFLLNESDPNAEQEFLQIFTFLETLGSEEEPLIASQGNFDITSLDITQALGGLEEFTRIDFAGTYSQTFDSPTDIRLLEASLFSAVDVVADATEVPDPGVLWGVISVCGYGLLRRLRKLMA